MHTLSDKNSFHVRLHVYLNKDNEINNTDQFTNAVEVLIQMKIISHANLLDGHHNSDATNFPRKKRQIQRVANPLFSVLGIQARPGYLLCLLIPQTGRAQISMVIPVCTLKELTDYALRSSRRIPTLKIHSTALTIGLANLVWQPRGPGLESSDRRPASVFLGPQQMSANLL